MTIISILRKIASFIKVYRCIAPFQYNTTFNLSLSSSEVIFSLRGKHSYSCIFYKYISQNYN